MCPCDAAFFRLLSSHMDAGDLQGIHLFHKGIPVGDQFWCSSASAGDRVSFLGAAWNSGLTAGLFGWDVYRAPSYRFRDIGGRLAYVPKTA